MISVRCPACAKVVGFEEADRGALVVCPFCRETFFVPSVALPVAADGPPAPPPAFVASLPPPPALPDDLRLVDEPEPPDELLPAEDAAPPPAPEPSPEPAPTPEPEAAPRPEPIPDLQLDPVRPLPEPPVGAEEEVKPTAVAPSLAAAAALSEALPLEGAQPPRPADMLEEVTDERDDQDRFKDDEEEKAEARRGRRWEERDEDEPRPRRRLKKKRRRPPPDPSPEPDELKRNRALGAAGTIVGGMILMGTCLHHLSAATGAWHIAACCGDLFALALVGVGLYFFVKR
jgi:hypothetical protein